MPLFVRDHDGTVMEAAQRIVWAGDTNLYRDSADTLKTDDSLIVGAVLTVLGAAAFTGAVTGLTRATVGLGNVDNTADTAKPVSTATTTALGLKAPIASPTFTGTVAGITKAHVGLSNVDNTTDAGKPVSTAQAAADALKVAKAGDTMTGLLALATGLAGVGGVTIGADVNLYRLAADVLMTDDTLIANGIVRANRLSSPGQYVQLSGGDGLGGRVSFEAASANKLLYINNNGVAGVTPGTIVFQQGGVTRLAISGDAILLGAAGDVNLYRLDSVTLATDANLTIVGAFTVIRPVAASVLVAKILGDAQNRFVIATDGRHQWGDGTAVLDTNLYRLAANSLKTDGALTVAGLLNLAAGAANVGGLTIGADVNLYRLGVDQLMTDDSFYVASGKILQAGQGTGNGNIVIQCTTGATATLFFTVAGVPKWQQYIIGGDPNLYVRDLANSKMQVTYTPGAGAGAGSTTFDSAVNVAGVLKPGRFTTALRPSAVTAGVGALIYDTTISKPIYSDGTIWRDAVGVAA